MARTIKEIYQEILAAKEAQSLLSSLNTIAGETMDSFLSEMSISKVSEWRLWAFICSFYFWKAEKDNAVFEKEIDYRISLVQPATLLWYQQTTLNFLLGKPLIWDENLWKFKQELLPSDDQEALKVVKHCAVTKHPDGLKVKIAGDNNGVPTILPTSTAVAVAYFLEQVKESGDDIQVVNNTADKLSIELDAYVDPKIINLSNGELHLESGVKPVELAINDYLINLSFDGRFTKTYFKDEIQKANGLVDANIKILQHKYAGFAYSDIDVSVVPNAGYFAIETLIINYKRAQV